MGKSNIGDLTTEIQKAKALELGDLDKPCISGQIQQTQIERLKLR